MLLVNRRSQKGFSLIEVVLAMAIGAGGILAFAGLQLRSIDIAEESYERQIAANLAYEFVERMSSNSQDVQARNVYQTGISTNITTSPWGVNYDRTSLNPGTWAQNCYNQPFNTPCSDEVLADFDVKTMRWLAAYMLPAGNIGLRRCGTGASQQYDCIVVTWEEGTIDGCDLAMDTTISKGTGLKDCYKLQVLIW